MKSFYIIQAIILLLIKDIHCEDNTTATSTTTTTTIITTTKKLEVPSQIIPTTASSGTTIKTETATTTVKENDNSTTTNKPLDEEEMSKNSATVIVLSVFASVALILVTLAIAYQFIKAKKITQNYATINDDLVNDYQVNNNPSLQVRQNNTDEIIVQYSNKTFQDDEQGPPNHNRISRQKACCSQKISSIFERMNKKPTIFHSSKLKSLFISRESKLCFEGMVF